MIGPTAYVINASDLKAHDPSNYLDKYADDTYLIVPASNLCTIPAELDNVSAWATANNLSLNVTKSCEMIVRRPRMAVNDPAIPPVHPGLKRVSELNILGVQISDRLEFTPHVNHITVTAVQSTYLYLDFASVYGPSRHPGAGSEVGAWFSLPCAVM